MTVKSGFALADKSDALLTFLAPLALIGLVHEGLENAWDCCVIGNIFTNAWQLHAPVPLPLVLSQKSNKSQDLSASEPDLNSFQCAHIPIQRPVWCVFVLFDCTIKEFLTKHYKYRARDYPI